MTLNGRSVTLAETKQFYGAHHKNFNKGRSIRYYQRQNVDL